MLRIVICDDEEVFRKQIVRKVNDYLTHKPNLQKSTVIVEYDSLTTLSHSLRPDILLLDIGFGEENCIETAKKLRDKFPGMLLIFITSLIGFIPEGYELNIFRYLLKSDFERCFNAYLDAAIGQICNAWEITRHGQKWNIIVSKVRYIEVQKRVLKVSMVPHQGLSSKEEFYGSMQHAISNPVLSEFIQVQRSFLVNPMHISKVTTSDVIIDDGTSIRISRQNANTIREKWFAWEAKQTWNM